MLGSLQATVDAASYLGANASPPDPGVDPSPLGWPDTRTDGAFQAIDVCGNLGCLFDPTNPTCERDEFRNCADDPCVEPIPWCFDRPDWVFTGGNWIDTVTTDTLYYAWSAASTNCAADPDGGVTRFYAGTLLLEVPVGAQGTYTACTNDVCQPDETCSSRPNYDCNGFVNVTDVQLLQLGFQGIFEFATLIQLDIHPCYPQGIIKVSDIQRVVLALQGQTYNEIGCRVPCPF